MVILVGERDGMGYMEYKGLNLVLCFETYSNLCDCKRTLPSFVIYHQIDRHVLILIAETQRENNVLYGGRVWVTQTTAQ